MKAPDEPGDQAGEPAPALAAMHIVHEDLSIDMRPVETPREPARIRARYRVRNDGPTQTVDLLFLAPGLRAGQVRHRGKRIAARVDERAQTSRTPNHSVAVQDTDALSFAVTFVPGEQDIEVTYQAAPDLLPIDGIDSFSVDYLLAPARRWASFGSLSLDIHVPPDWQILDLPSALAPSAEDGGYQARFAGLSELLAGAPLRHHRVSESYHWDLRELPADTLRVHVVPARWPYLWLGALAVLTHLLALAAPVLAWLRLRRSARRGAPTTLGLRLLSFALSAVAVAGLPLLSVWLEGTWYPHRAMLSYGPIFALLGTWFFGGLACVLGHALVGWRRHTPAA
jgi:hypothetical protein